MAITLEKQGDAHQIDLSKHNNSQKLLVKVNLNWNPVTSGGFFSKFSRTEEPDLDLGCMYEMINGRKGVIQPLGKNFGSENYPPYILLDKDDRSGESEDGENMTIYRPDLIKRVMFFALIYEGAKDFQSVNGQITFDLRGGEKVKIELNNPDPNLRFCAAATISNLGSQLRIIKEEKYFSSHTLADDYYRFGFRWTAGKKD